MAGPQIHVFSCVSRSLPPRLKDAGPPRPEPQVQIVFELKGFGVSLFPPTPSFQMEVEALARGKDLPKGTLEDRWARIRTQDKQHLHLGGAETGCMPLALIVPSTLWE